MRATQTTVVDEIDMAFGRPARLSWSVYAYVAVVVGAFAAVLSRALTFGYIEGDDAASVAYHVLGRNPALQLPYSPWQGMMDRWLALLPAREPVLRVTAEGVTSAAACASVLLMMALAVQWTALATPRQRICAAAAVLVAAPELFYLGLVYEPSMLALTLVLSAHLLGRRGLSKSGASKSLALAIAAAIFGLAAACRWDIAAYGIVIVADFALADGVGILKIARQRLLDAVLWAVAATASACLAIAASGYGPAALRETLRVAITEVTPKRASALHIAEVIGSQQTLFTPLLVLLLIVGAVTLWKTRPSLLALTLLAVFPVAPYLYSREPKMLIPLFPPLLAVAIAGFNRLWWYGSGKARAAVAVLAIIPWLVGLQIDASGTSYGPGFQRTVEVLTSPRPHVRLGLSGGFAVPTPEGPRPLGGHAWVLLGGEWRNFVRDMESEQKQAIDIAVQQGIPLVQLDRDSLLLPYLTQLGWTTRDPEHRITDRSSLFKPAITVREFFKGEQRLRSIVVNPPNAIFEPGVVTDLSTLAPNGRALLYFGNYASNLRQLARIAPEATMEIGPYSAVEDLRTMEIAHAPESINKGELH